MTDYTNIDRKNVGSARSVSSKIKVNTHKLIVTPGTSSRKDEREQPIALPDREAKAGSVLIATVQSWTLCQSISSLV